MFPAWDPTALRLVAPMKGIANLRSQPPHRGILRISPTNILLTPQSRCNDSFIIIHRKEVVLNIYTFILETSGFFIRLFQA